MKILLVAATKHEIEPTLINNVTDVLFTGVGVPATIYHLQKKIQHFHYNMVIQAGIAGAFTPILPLGETVVVKKDTFGDLAIEENGKLSHIFSEGLGDKNEFPYNKGWLINDHGYLSYSDLLSVKAITINKISDSEIQKHQLIETYHPDIESMEGAALHYVCLQENIPFLQLRSISNYVGERDKNKWKMKLAIGNLNEELAKLIDHLKG